MATAADTARIPWWREPTKDQWYAWVAAWLGWVLDSFDFTVFLLIMVPIAKEFDVPLTDVAIVFTLTLWMRLVGATAAGWMADRLGRKKPLMISIAWFSVCNFIAGFSPTFWFLLLFRTLLGIGMGAEWPAGAALAMEQWPQRSRGFMSGVAGFVGSRFPAVERVLLAAIRQLGLAGHVVDRHSAGAGDCLRPLLCQGAGGLGREPTAAKGAKPERQGPARRDLQARHRRQYAERLLVSVRRVCHLLLDKRAVRDPSAKGFESQHRADRNTADPVEPVGVSSQFELGAGVRSDWATLGDDHSGSHFNGDRADIPAVRAYDGDHRRLYRDRLVCRRRHVWSSPGLSK